MSWLDILRKGENHFEETSDNSEWWNICCSNGDVAQESKTRHSSERAAYELHNSNRRNKLVNFKWTAEEDALLKRLVHELKFDWETMVKYFPGKIPSQVAKRWINKLDPSIKKVRWTTEEDDTICSMVTRIGRNWKEISKHLECRPPDAVKSRFHSNLRKKLDNKEHLSLEDLDPDSFLCLKDETTSPTMNIDNTSQTHTDTKTSSSLGKLFNNLSTDTISNPSPNNYTSESSSLNPSSKFYVSKDSTNPSPKNSSEGSSTNPSPKNYASTNLIESKLSTVSNGITKNHMNVKSSFSREQKKEIIRELHKRVEYLQTAIVTTSDQINKLEEEIFGSESDL